MNHIYIIRKSFVFFIRIRSVVKVFVEVVCVPELLVDLTIALIVRSLSFGGVLEGRCGLVIGGVAGLFGL